MVQTVSILASGLDASNCIVNCSNKGSCAVESGKLVCKCDGNYTGSACATSLDPCTYSPCLNNGTCVTNSTSNGTLIYTCDCGSYYYGSQCETKHDLCANVTCSGNGDCVDKGTTTKCSCYYLFSGDNCEIKSSKKQQIDTIASVSSIVAILFIVFFYLSIAALDLMNLVLWWHTKAQIAKIPKKKLKPVRVRHSYIP